jgi:hypothetical protein
MYLGRRRATSSTFTSISFIFCKTIHQQVLQPAILLLKCLKLINEWLRLYILSFPIFFPPNEMFESHRISSLNICNTFVHMHKKGLSVMTVITPIIWWWLGAVPSVYVWVHRRQEWQISRAHTWLVSKDFTVCVGSLKGKISGWSASYSVSVPYTNCHF